MRLRLTVGLVAAIATLTGCKREPSLEDQAKHMLEIGAAKVATTQLWANAGTLECRPVKKDVCSADGCTSSQPQAFIRLTPSDGTYQRCDDRGCDSYKAAVSYSGIWTNMALPDRATFARVTSSLDFVEVAASNDVFYLFRGSCKPAPRDD